MESRNQGGEQLRSGELPRYKSCISYIGFMDFMRKGDWGTSSQAANDLDYCSAKGQSCNRNQRKGQGRKAAERQPKSIKITITIKTRKNRSASRKLPSRAANDELTKLRTDPLTVCSAVSRSPRFGKWRRTCREAGQFSKERISSPGDRPAGFQRHERAGVEWPELLRTCEEGNELTILILLKNPKRGQTIGWGCSCPMATLP
jgi:hypothetical protein